MKTSTIIGAATILTGAALVGTGVFLRRRSKAKWNDVALADSAPPSPPECKCDDIDDNGDHPLSVHCPLHDATAMNDLADLLVMG